MIRPHIINLDITKGMKMYPPVKIVKGDIGSNLFIINLTDNDVMLPLEETDIVTLSFGKSDNIGGTQPCTIVDAAKGQISALLIDQASTTSGPMLCEVVIKGASPNRKTSASFEVEVTPSVVDDLTIISTPVFNELTDALNSINQAVANAGMVGLIHTQINEDIVAGNLTHNTLANTISQGDTLDAELKSDITTGTSLDESLKVSILQGGAINTAEVDRIASELIRNSNEVLRVNAEAVRVPNEVARVANEENRVSKEIDRVSKENDRVNAENIRIPNEENRVASETARNNAETIRLSNETARQGSETTRLSAEGTRLTNEQTRVTHEDSRVSSENTRLSNESTRVTNEADRVSKESTRVSNESSRVTVEQNRVTAENTRISNETTRTGAESTRVSNESTRQSNETGRVSAESARVASETTRGTSEGTRNTNETGRVAAETSRANAESSRVTVEAARVTAENTRKANETTRGTNETDRQNRFNQLTTAQQQASEVVNARTSTIKAKTFPTLNDRVEEIEVEARTPQYSVEITQNASTFTLGKGKNSSGTDVDVSASVVNGVVNYSLEGNTVDITSGGITTDLAGTNQNVIEYSTGDGKVHYEVEGETLDIYSGGVKADFVGKQSGSVVENCNISKITQNDTSLLAPSTFFTEVNMSGTGYSKFSVLDGVCYTATATTDKAIPQQLFSFDLIKTYEKKWGTIPSTTQSVADKIVWLKANVPTMFVKWYGYGSCPSGNKANIGVWRTDLVNYSSPVSVSYSVPTLYSYQIDTTFGNKPSNTIDSNGFVHFLAYTDMASTTSPTLLVMSGHGLISGDIVENITRSLISTTGGSTTNSIVTNPITGQSSGDIINKYHWGASRTATTGTNDTTLVITAHGLSTGDYIMNNTRATAKSKVTVVDINTLTLTTPIVGQISGDSIVPFKFFGQQIAESTVIPSTIYTDYISLDITLKPSYKSVGEDVGGAGVHKIEVLSRGKSLIPTSYYPSIVGTTCNGVTFTLNGDGTITANGTVTSSITSYFSDIKDKLMKGKTYTFSGASTNMTMGVRINKFDGTTVYNITFVYDDTVSSIKPYIQQTTVGTVITNEVLKPMVEYGSTSTAYAPYTSDTNSLTLTQPLRKINATVFDKYAEGVVNRNISNWVTLDGSLSWTNDTPNRVLDKIFKINVSNPTALGTGVQYPRLEIRYDGVTMVDGTSNLNGTSLVSWSVDSVMNYISIPNVDSGMCINLTPSNNEIKAYFYGWKMCHSDGVTPYQINETNYTPSTWAEWTKDAGVVGDSTGLEWTCDGSTYKNVYCNTTLKTSTKYGFLINVVSNTLNGYLKIGGSTAFADTTVVTPGVTGNIKFTPTTLSTLNSNAVKFYTDIGNNNGTKIKLKDIRVFELPIGSQIETDFNTLSSDQLTAKYLFYGLNPKNWKKITDGSGITSTLPTATYAGYTPYRMLYQLATPTTESITVPQLSGFANGSLLVDGGVVPNKTNILTSLLSASSGSWKALDVDMPTLPNGVKNDVVGGVVMQKVGRSTINGTENWAIMSLQASTNTLMFQTTNTLAKATTSNSVDNTLLCDKFIVASGNNNYTINDNEAISITTGSMLQIRINKSKLTTQDLAGFKAWLQANPTTVYYELATPIVGSISLGGKSSVETLNGSCLSVTSNVLGSTPQIKVKFNLIDMIEKKYGTLPCASDLASKIAWVKGNISNITCNDYIYGLGFNGNKACISIFKGSSWTPILRTITSSVPSTDALTVNLTSDWQTMIQSDGFIHYLTYTDTTNVNSSGVFTPSTIYMDYISLQVTFKPQYRSVGEDFAQTGNNRVIMTSKKQDGSIAETVNLKFTQPLRRVSSTVADIYKDGKVTRNISNWVTLDGSLGWVLSSSIYNNFKKYYFPLSSIYLGSSLIIKNNGSSLQHLSNNNPTSFDQEFLDGNNSIMTIANTDTGFTDSYTPSSAEIKSYFYGWKMCHSDGVSPYLPSLVPYTPSTWAEWTKDSGVVADSSGATLTSNGNWESLKMLSTLKPSTKYGYLYNVISSNLTKNLTIKNPDLSYWSLPTSLGNNKVTITSVSSITNNERGIQLSSSEPIGNSIKLKDIRVFELPTGSQIETDFNTLTADQLTAKYKFYGLNPKNWKSVVDGSGLTSTLPVAQPTNYTPYKMLYQLATPTTEILNVDGNNPLEPTGVLPLGSYEKGSLVIDAVNVIPTTKYTVPLNFRSMGMDNNALANSIKNYVLQLDAYTTASLLGIADRELRMKSVALLTTETTADLKAKINELINIWK